MIVPTSKFDEHIASLGHLEFIRGGGSGGLGVFFGLAFEENKFIIKNLGKKQQAYWKVDLLGGVVV